MPDMFRFAHISDLHLMPLPAVSPWRLVNKRLFAYLSWHRKRKQEHRREVLDALTTSLDEQKPDHICVTGDLTNLGLEEEFHAAARWLGGVAPRGNISVIPGNHDACVPGALAKGLDIVGHWMSDDDGQSGFPFTHRRGPVEFVGVSSAVATPPGLASGRLGGRQRNRLSRILSAPRDDHRLRVLLMHHPPHRRSMSARKALRDDRKLQSILHRGGVGLVLHGHGHHAHLSAITGQTGPIPVLGAGSASAIGYHRDAGHYYLIAFDPDKDAGRVQVTSYHYDANLGRFNAAEEWWLAVPVPGGRQVSVDQ